MASLPMPDQKAKEVPFMRTRRLKTAVFTFSLFCALVLSGPLMAQDTAAPPAAAEAGDAATTPTLPPAFDPVTAPPATTTAAPAAPAAPDPCAAFAASADSYLMCQDRMQKMERMKEANQRRLQKPAPAVDPAAEKAAAEAKAAADAKAKELADKVDALEKELNKKERRNDRLIRKLKDKD